MNNQHKAERYTLVNKIYLSLYVLLYTLLLPFILIKLFYRSLTAPAYRQRVCERFGKLSDDFKNTDSIDYWVHAVSVGETVAAIPFIKSLIERGRGKQSVYVTTTTVTGSARVASQLGDRVKHSYMPYDWPIFVFLFIKKLRPKYLIIMETELWPVTLYLCRKFNVNVVVVNARLSDKSLAGYQRIKQLIAPALQNIVLGVQTQNDADNFMALDVRPEQINITGNIKFDLPLEPQTIQYAEQLKLLVEEFAKRKIWLAASTHEGEDALLLQAHQIILATYPEALLIIVPRHPERFNQVANLIESQFTYQRLSQMHESNILSVQSKVLLGDKMGVLQSLYGLCQVAFIGGSLVPVGGHNMLEAAVWKLPILTGPHRHNFLAVSEKLIACKGLALCDNVDAIAHNIKQLFGNAGIAKEQGNNAYQVVVDNRGALKNLLALL